MKKNIAVILILMLVVIPVGCSGQNNPEDTVDNYFKAVKKFLTVSTNHYNNNNQHKRLNTY